jgi:hypothetical protein
MNQIEFEAVARGELDCLGRHLMTHRKFLRTITLCAI